MSVPPASGKPSGAPQEIVLVFDFGGVISTSPFPVLRRYTVKLMSLVLSVAALRGSGSALTPAAGSPEQYANLFFDVIMFAESSARAAATADGQQRDQRRGSIDAANTAVTSASATAKATAKATEKLSSWARLETGRCTRLEFVEQYHAELKRFLEVLAWTPEDVKGSPPECDRAVVEKMRAKYIVLGTPTIASVLLEKFDAETFLCIIEKCALRKNVLNMIHALRAKSHQEIKVAIVTNNWEPEGGYLQQQRLTDAAGESPFLPVMCPNEWDDERRTFFAVHGLFDCVCQSYQMKRRKPSPDLFLEAIRACGGPMANRHFFYFDDIQHNVDAASALQVVRNADGHTIELDGATAGGSDGAAAVRAFEKAYFIRGATSVFTAVHEAVAGIGARDAKWTKVAAFLADRIAPMFQPLQSRDGRVIGWEDAEEQNSDGNSVFLPPPLNAAIHTGAHPNKMTPFEVNRLLYYLARHVPQYFPLNPPPVGKMSVVDLAEEPSLATSSGPVAVEYFVGGMSNPTYRITLRTGSFVVRKQPKGPLLKGAHDIKREFNVLTHLRATSDVPVPKCITFCDDTSVLGTPFYVMRYVEGRIVRSASELLRPSIVRRYSRSRQLNTRHISAKPYFVAAIEVLARLHAAPIPPNMRRRERVVAGGASGHPLLHLVRVWEAQYARGLRRIRERGGTTDIVEGNLSAGVTRRMIAAAAIPHFEFLTEMLKQILQGTAAAPSGGAAEMEAPPLPEHEALVHGDFKLDNFIFDFRSCEERRVKVPPPPAAAAATRTPPMQLTLEDASATAIMVLQPRIVALMDFELCSVGDPLTDLAYLTLFNVLPPPRGIAGLRGAHGLFPSTEELLAHYCQRTGALRGLSDERRMQILRVYQAAMCQKLCGIIHGVVVRSLMGNASDAKGGLKLQPMMNFLAATGIELIGGEVAVPAVSKL